MVYGTPQPQGSARAFNRRGGGLPIVTCDNKKNKPWRQQISGVAQYEMDKAGLLPITGMPVYVEAVFYFDKPKSVKKSVTHKITRPDVDKLLRSLLDGLKGIVYKDDSQVVSAKGTKEFGTPERVEIFVSVL